MAKVKRRRVKKPRLPPSVKPHECVILAVDPAENSGWAIWDSGLLCEWGEADVFGEGPAGVIDRALKLAADAGVKCVLVVERPFSRRIGSGGFDTTNVGAADKVWRERAKRAGFSKRIVRVYPATWRARVLGAPWHMAKRADVRRREQEIAPLVVREHGFDEANPPGPDACPAILIGKWGVHAGEVGAVLSSGAPRGKKLRALAELDAPFAGGAA